MDKNFEKLLKESLDEIRAEDKLTAQTKAYLAQQIVQRKRRPRPALRAAAAAACLLLLTTVSAGGAWVYLTPDAYISIDINPSLEFGINRFGRIVSVESFNDDGQDLAEQLDIRYMDYNDALEEFLSEAAVQAYLSDGAFMSVTVACSDDEKSSRILANVESCTAGHSNISCHSANIEEMDEAHSAGLSLGKYRAYLELKELDPSVTTDEIRDLSMREIRDLIDSYGAENNEQPDSSGNSASENAGSGEPKNQGYHHGTGHGRHEDEN